VAASARRLRPAQGLAPGPRRPRRSLPPVAEPVCQPLTPRRATWVGLRREAKRTEAEAHQLAQLREHHAESAEAIDRAQDCAHRVRQRHPERLDPW
jgi:transposase